MLISYYRDSTVSVFSPVSQMDIASLSLALSLSALSLSLSLSLCKPLSIGKYADLILRMIVPFLCFHHFTDGQSLSHSLTHSLSMQSPIDRDICRSHIMDIVPFLCSHCFTDGHSLSLSLCNLLLIGKYADLILWR